MSIRPKTLLYTSNIEVTPTLYRSTLPYNYKHISICTYLYVHPAPLKFVNCRGQHWGKKKMTHQSREMFKSENPLSIIINVLNSYQNH